MEDRIYDFWAATLQDGYIANLIELVKRAGSARELYEMKPEHIKEALDVTDRMLAHILKLRDGIDIERKYEAMVNDNIIYVNNGDTAYPKRLLNIVGRPYGLFVKGALPVEGKHTVAIVGARECTEYGRLMAEYLGDRLAKNGVDVVSGMAWGIDGISQMAAVKAGGKSYGILGCGVDVIYPRKNGDLYNMLIQNGNGVISEYAPKTKAEPRRFPPRNRIISGMCDVLVVVEARARSGTLITVEMAMDQGKTIMTIPGRITDPLSVGCLNLIRDGAIPITCIDDILQELLQTSSKEIKPQDIDNRRNAKNRKENSKKLDIDSSELVGVNLSDKEKQVLNVIEFEPVTVDFIVEKTQIRVDEVITILTNLELLGAISEVSSFNFVRRVKVGYDN